MEDPSFVDILADLGSAFLTLPLIATLSQVAIAKAFCKLQFHSSNFSFINSYISSYI